MNNVMHKNLAKVGVLMGGFSQEKAVSNMSGQGVLQALLAKGINAKAFDPAQSSLAQLEAENFSACFIALHGRYGEDGVIQSILEHLRIPYTGSGVLASAMAMHKETTKRIWQSYPGIITPASLTLEEGFDIDAVIAELGLPLMLKPAREGSSIGITKVAQKEALLPAYLLARSYDTCVLAEEYIIGRELTCAILELDGVYQTLPLVEIKAPNENYDYQNKYFTDDVKYLCPAPVDAQTAQKISDISLAAFKALGCRGWARADFMLNPQNQAYILEMNTSPGMTSHSLFPMAAQAMGLSYDDLIVHLLTCASLDYLDKSHSHALSV